MEKSKFMLRSTWFCTEATQSGNKNKDCVYSSQLWDLNNQQFPATSEACCISGILRLDLKVEWQVFGLAEQYVFKEAQYQCP